MSENLRDVLGGMSTALTAEIKSASREELRSFDIKDGAHVASLDEGYLYSFKVEQNVILPADTPIQLSLSRDQTFAGVVVGYQDFHILLSIDTFLGEYIPRARLLSDASFILIALRKYLLELIGDEVAAPSPVSECVLGKRTPNCGADTDLSSLVKRDMHSGADPSLVPNAWQEDAISRCSGSDLHFVWGPPGTGKTATLAQVAYGLAAKGEKVLVLSHSNAAVDVAMLRIHDAFCATSSMLPSGKILRVGWPYLEQARERQEILVEGVLAKLEPELIGRKRLLEERMKVLVAELRFLVARESLQEQLNEIRRELAAIRTRIAEARKALVGKAQILGSTVSRFIIDPHVTTWSPDAVIVDETSMVSFPFIFAAATRARCRILFFGDFRQLPPIHASDEKIVKHWMGKDAFELTGIKGNIEAGRPEPRVTLLEEQYRMAPRIAAVVSWLAYEGRLRDGAGTAERVGRIKDIAPWPGESLVLLDSSALRSACSPDPRPGSRSRTNPVHSAVVVSVVQKLLSAGVKSAAVITPYRAQSRLLFAALQEEQQAKRISIATVHKFQGSESDVVFLDLVDALPEKKASALTGTDEDLALRLLNVAASRARGKLFVLADVNFIESYHPALSPCRKLLALLRRHGTTVELSPQILSDETGVHPVTWFNDWAAAQPALASDMSFVQQKAGLNFPSGFGAGTEVIEALQLSARRHCAITVFCQFDEARRLENDPVDLRLMTRPGGFCALLDDHTAYIGGLSPTGAVARLSGFDSLRIHREVYLGTAVSLPPPSAEADRDFQDLLGFCLQCGQNVRPLILDGKWWLSCSNGHERRSLDCDILQSLVETLKLNCGCGAPVKAVQAGDAVFIGCSNFAYGCDSDTPTMWDLFGNQG